jgi:hypothetical protein
LTIGSKGFMDYKKSEDIRKEVKSWSERNIMLREYIN